MKFRIFNINTRQYSCLSHEIILDYLDSPNKYIVEEFTGIFDVDGNEIYEGDILEEERDHDKDFNGDELTYKNKSVVIKKPGFFSHDEDDIHGLIRNVDNFNKNIYVKIVGNKLTES